jgi:hypothetical protein
MTLNLDLLTLKKHFIYSIMCHGVVLGLILVVGGCEASSPILKPKTPERGTMLEVFDPDLSQGARLDGGLVDQEMTNFNEWGSEDFMPSVDHALIDHATYDAYDPSDDLDLGPSSDQSQSTPPSDAALYHDMTPVAIDRGGMIGTDPLSLLPIEDCIFIKQDECRNSIERTEAETCQDWSELYRTIGASVWTGDERSCNFGIATDIEVDFLNFLRIQRGYSVLNTFDDEPEFRYSSNAEECAHALSLLNLDYIDRCGDSLSEAIDDTDYLHFYGAWNPVIHLMEGLSSNIDSNAGVSLIPRHYILDRRQGDIEVGHRGRATCIALERRITAITKAFFPGVGPLPIELVAVENHNGRMVPWSAKIDASLSELDFQVFEVALGNRTRFPGLIIQEDNGKIIGFLPDRMPRTNLLYEAVVEGLNIEGTSLTYKFYLWFLDCDLRFPSSCEPLERCPLTHTYCDHPGQGGQPWQCRWRSEIPLGQPCDDSVGGGCKTGACLHDPIGLTNGNRTCKELCYPRIDNNPQSCSNVCPAGSTVMVVTEDVSACHSQ